MNETPETRSDLKIALTISEAAKATGISRSHIHKLLTEGSLTRRKVGKRTLILREDLEAFLRSRPTEKWRGGRAGA